MNLKINEKKPYISFVVVGRNDNYGHNFIGRFQKFLDNLTYLCEKYKLDSELIIVEWNPPIGNKKLYEVLKMNSERKHLKIRFIEVSRKIHKSLENSNKIPLFEYVGKNVGIRKARGEFILITNPDIIFGERIIKEISKKKLNNKTLYRTDRFDLNIDIPLDLKTSRIELFCEKNWFGCWSVRWGRYYRGVYFFKNIVKILMRAGAKILPRKSYLRYHAGAPGDFMLISKKGWDKIEGFPEIKRHGGMDSYGCIMAVVAKNKFRIMKGRTYHQFHESDVSTRPKCDLERYNSEIRKMLKNKKPLKYNDSNWGLNNKKFKERVY